ncbi:MAG: Wzz/FepE/Etk N-terminal domain-containing protein [Mesorhizobium sp.]|nr:Wzz/FepE/Etk N-terminal domain-containing protein [Mesorhizobium sp.]MCO5160402.1 Wzz/FepE/Etk N-terminal domain-containing protein [Mesorhizobium sp.]
MFNPDKRDQGKPPRSLLSFGQQRAKPSAAAPSPASLTSYVPEGLSPAERHRLARSRREAKSTPLLDALAARPEAEPAARNAAPPDAPVSPPAVSAAVGSAPRPASQPGLANTGSAPQPAPAAAEGEVWRPLIDPLKIWSGIVRSRWIILATTVAGAALGVVIALSTPKKYESVAELLVDPRDIKISDRNVTEGGLPNDATLAIVENQVKVLTSGNVLAKVVDKLNLAADPEFNGQERSFGLKTLISELRSIFSRSEKNEGDLRRALAIQGLAESLDVERGGKTFVVSISAVTQSAEKSALIANTLTQTFLESYGDIQSDTAGRASDELTSRLAEMQKGVEEAERKVEAYRTERDLFDAQGRLISDDEMVKLNEQLTIARARTIELNARAASIRDLNPDAIVGGSLPEQISSPVMAELRTQYATSKQEVERLSVRLGPRHPERLAAEAQLAGARESLASELRRINSSIQVDLKRAVQLEQDLASRLAQLKSRQAQVSEDLVTVRELEREAAAKRAVYESFLLRARETSEQRGINTANMSVISVAQPPLEALGPSRSMMVIAATILGFMAGIGIGGVRGAVDSLRTGGGGSPAVPPAPRRAPARARPEPEDEIDRIMRSAAGEWTFDPPPSPKPSRAARTAGPATTDAQKAAPAGGADAPKPSTLSDDGKKDSPMNPAHAYPFAPPPGYPAQAAPMQQPVPPQPWWDQQAAYAAQQQAAYQAWLAARPPQPAYPPQPAAPQWASWPQPGYAQSAYPVQPVYPLPHLPLNMQAPQPWPAQPQYAPPTGWSPPQESAPPPQPQSFQHQQARAENNAIDEIRESLREFRDAVRDLAVNRARSRA